MPIIYEYLGITIGFYSNDHYPVHIHATYNDAVLKVVLHNRDGKVYRTTYHPLKGTFPTNKLRQLKSFVAKYKEAILFAWEQVFKYNNSIQKIVITKKI